MSNLGTLLQNNGLSVAPAAVVLVSILVGLGALLYGYRLVRLFVFLVGFAIGTVAASIFASGILPLIVGLVVGILCETLWDLGVFVIGCALGGLLAVAVGVDGAIPIGLAAIVGGILAIAVRKFMLIVSTSWMGAYLLVGAAAMMFKISNLGLLLAASLLVTCVGVACQYTVTAGGKKNASDAKKED